MQFARWDLQQSLRLATLNPARVAGLDTGGCLKPRLPADILVLNPEGEIQETIMGGVCNF
jgi:N-acetylglucosamine-6-phosphate deacetylase